MKVTNNLVLPYILKLAIFSDSQPTNYKKTAALDGEYAASELYVRCARTRTMERRGFSFAEYFYRC